MYKENVLANQRQFPRQLKPARGAAITDNRPQMVVQKKQLAAMQHENMAPPGAGRGFISNAVIQKVPINQVKQRKTGSKYKINSGDKQNMVLKYVRKVMDQDKFVFSDIQGTTVTVDGSVDVTKLRSNSVLKVSSLAPPKKRKNMAIKPTTNVKKKKEAPEKKYVEELNNMEKDDNTEYIKYGGGQSTKIVKVLKNREEKGDTKIQKLHLGTDTAVYPHTFKDQRIAQVMRWVSTVLFNALMNKKCNPYEVQAGYFGDKLYIAGNTNASKKTLEELLGLNKDQSLKESLSTIDTTVNSTWAQDTFLKERLIRHSKKLKDRILGDKIGDQYKHLEKAFNEKPVVAMEDNKNDEGLHAERRIKKRLGGDFNKTITRGLKRPCTICYISNYSERPKNTIDLFPERSGPLWTSGAATKGYDMNDKNDLEKIVKKSVHSHVTVPKKEKDKQYPKVTYDMDSESDSDAE